jgi:hypothetical protein
MPSPQVAPPDEELLLDVDEDEAPLLDDEELLLEVDEDELPPLDDEEPLDVDELAAGASPPQPPAATGIGASSATRRGRKGSERLRMGRA